MVDNSVQTNRWSWSFWKAVPVVLAVAVLFELGESLYLRLVSGNADAVVWIATIAFIASSVFSFVLWWGRIRDFFRSVQVGIVIFIFATVGCVIGVLVPQLDNFEDPEERVTEENYEKNYSAFKWATGYFVYHMTHLYGIGMPEGDLPDQAKAGIEKLGKKYGKELSSNREKEMRAAFRNNAKNQAIREHIEDHDGTYRTLFNVFTFLDFNRAYKSAWFLGLMCLLFGCVLSNLLRFGMAPLWTGQRIGFALSHLGVIVILIGGGVSKAFTIRGIAHLNIGDVSSEYFAFFNMKKPRELPFELRLDDFKRDDWDKIEVHFLDEKFSSRPPRYTIWKGYELPLDYDDQDKPRYTIRVKEKFPRVKVSDPQLQEFFDSSLSPDAQEWNPVVELKLQSVSGNSDGDPELHNFLFARSQDDRSILLHPQNQWRLRYLWAQTPEELERLLAVPVEERIGTLIVQIGQGPDTKPVHLDLRNAGERFELADGYSVELLGAVGRFMMQHSREGGIKEPVLDFRPLVEQSLSFPAIKIRIHSPQENQTEDRWVIHQVDAEEFGFQRKYKFKEIYTNLSWDFWRSPVAKRYALVDTPGKKLELVELGSSSNRQYIETNQAISMPSHSTLTVLKRAQVAGFHYDFSPIPEEQFFHHDPSGIVLEVDTPSGTVTHRLATTNGADRVLIDGKLGIVFLEDQQSMPYEWRSKLSAMERDLDGSPRVVSRGEIRVNDYFSWRGYHFFQTNAIPEDPTYSGIGVVYDPGMMVVVVGMYIVMFGVGFALFRRLIVKKETPA